MLLDEKPPADLTLQDIEQLVSASVCESQRLEYKRDWWGDNDEGKREMLRDIAALANAFGGHIVLGVETRRERGAGDLECPTAIVGIPRQNYTERILASCRDNLDPRCNGIDAVQVECPPENVVVVVRVLQSFNAPHMVRFKGLNQFWKRYSTGKQAMTTFEIREAFLARASYQERLLELVQRQQEEVIRRNRDGLPLLHIWAAPLMPLPQEIDIRDGELRRILGDRGQLTRPGTGWTLDSGTPLPSLHGIGAEEGLPGEYRCLELHRSTGLLGFATVGFTDTIEQGGRQWQAISATGFAIYTDLFAALANTLYRALEIQAPIACGCTLLNVRNHYLRQGGYWRDLSQTAWPDTQLDLEHRVADSLDSLPKVAKHLNDRLWQAFHFDGCPLYESGRLVLPW